MAKIEFNGARASANSRVLTRIAVCGALGLSLSWLPSMALAQTNNTDRLQNAGDSLALDPVTVEGRTVDSSDTPTQGYTAFESDGATKTDSPLMQTPQAVEVVTRDQIEDQGARTINNALRYTPGVFTGLAGSSSRQISSPIPKKSV